MKEIYKGKAVHLFSGPVLLPNGKTAELDFIRHPGASAVVPLLPNGNVVLIHQYRHAAGGYLYEIPAGKLDKGESPEVCAIREVAEEVGYHVGNLEKLTAIFTVPGFCDEVIHLYLGTDLTPCSQRLDEDEVIEIVEMPFDEAIDKIKDQTLRDAKSIVGLQLAYPIFKEQQSENQS
ncbi:MAG: NUDIX hydrolase [Nitrospiria bacterium]